MARVFISPSRYVQGPGELARLGDYTKTYGAHALVVISAGGLRRFGDVVSKSLEDAGVACTYDNFNGECSQAEIDRLVEVLRGCGADVVVGVGGGKIFDTAKAVAAAVDAPVAGVEVDEVHRVHGLVVVVAPLRELARHRPQGLPVDEYAMLVSRVRLRRQRYAHEVAQVLRLAEAGALAPLAERVVVASLHAERDAALLAPGAADALFHCGFLSSGPPCGGRVSLGARGIPRRLFFI